MRKLLLALMFPAVCFAANDFDGADSKIENTSADVMNSASTISVVVWAYQDGQGESNLGRLFAIDEALTNPGFFDIRNNSANVLGIDKTFSGTDGFWTFAANFSQWNSICVTYDWSSNANDPLARVNGASATVNRTTAPTVNPESPATGYAIGNNSAQTRTWDGRIAYLQVFNVILTAAECDQAARWPGSVRRGLRLYVKGLNPTDHPDGVYDLSGNGFHGTDTSVTDNGVLPPARRKVIGGGTIVGN